MKKTMGSYQSYFKQLEEKFEKQKSDLRDHLVVQLTDRKMLSEQVLRKLKADASLSPAKRDGLVSSFFFLFFFLFLSFEIISGRFKKKRMRHVLWLLP